MAVRHGLADVPSVVNDAIDALQRDADDKRIVVERDLDSGAGAVAGDPARIQQIIWNLLSNAIKFTAEGGQITVRVRKVGADVEISIADTGVGIRSEFLPHNFDRFQQADQSMTSRLAVSGSVYRL